MAGRIPQEFINDLLERIDVAEVIGDRLPLKRAGKEYKARCPFHDERTPSFHVVPDKGFYHCFGCGAHGTALTFLLEHERLGFVDAVEALARLAGMQVPRAAAPSPRDEKRATLLELLDRADRFFQVQLRQHPERERAVAYLKGRGIEGATAQRFGLGFAPPGRENLKRALGGDDEAIARLVEAGLLVRPEDEGERGRSWDRFRDRVMFPIRDARGRTIAFGGRVIGDGRPKYLNSPETPVFHKGRELYGLWECRRAVRDPQRVVLVEGYMDVIGLAQAGVPEAVASLGTAATAEHLHKLFRLAPEVVFCFDGDAAGRRAAWKAVQTALDVLSDGVEVRLLLLPEGEDPDSLVRREGGEAFRERMGSATPLSEFLFGELAAELDLATMDGRARLVHRALPLVARVPGRMLRTMMVQRLAELAKLPVSAVEEGLAEALAGERGGAAPPGARRDAPDEPAPPPETARGRADDGRPARVRLTKEDRALALLLHHPELAERVTSEALEALEGIERERVALLAAVLRRLADEPGLGPMALVSEHLGTPAHAILADLAGRERLLGPDERSREFDEAIRRLVEERKQLRRRALYERIQTGEFDPAEYEEWRALKRETEAGAGH